MKWSEWSLTNLESYVPTYGLNGGPGWTNGSRNPDAPERVPTDSLDEKFAEHDDAYKQAEIKYEAGEKTYTEYRQAISKADKDLLDDIDEVDWSDSRFSTPEKLDEAKAYASMAEKAFTAKSAYNEVMESAIAPAVDTVSSVASTVTSAITSAWDAVSDFFSGKQDDLANAQAPDSAAAEADGEAELDHSQENVSKTEADTEWAKDSDLDDQRAAEPPPPPPSNNNGGGYRPPNDGSPSGGIYNSGETYGHENTDADSQGGHGGYPIVLDLDQDNSIELTALDESNAFYDFDGDEYLNRVGWVSGDDGFLAIDIGGDGIIELGSEIAFADFGRCAVGELELSDEVEAYLAAHGLLNDNLDFNGDGLVNVADFDSDGNGLISDLEGLRYFDSNADGVIDSGDAVWGHLRVWQDYDQDGTSDAGEVSTLDGLGDTSLNIASISLVSDANKVEGGEYGEGNVVYGLGSYSTADGGTGLLGDVAFAGSNIGYKEDADGTVRMKYDDVETVYRDDSGGSS